MAKCKTNCCCDKCDTRLNCSAGSIIGGAGTVNGGSQCCKCVPTRLCFTLTMPDYTVRRQVIKIDCITGAYFASFDFAGTVLDVRFEVIQDVEGNCKVMLSSSFLSLGPSVGGYDTRLYQDLAGSFDDSYGKLTRRVACQNPNYEFELDLEGTSFVEGIAILQIRRAAYIAAAESDRNWRVDPYACMCQCACVELTTLSGEVFKQITCIDGNNQWNAPFDLLDDQWVIVQRLSADDEPTRLSMTSSIGDGEEISAECGCMTNMYAEWETSYGTVKIKCSKQGCVDCNCWCEFLCITYQDDVRREIAIAQWTDEVGGWEVSLNTSDDGYPSTFVITKTCDAARGVTQISMSSDIGDGDPIDVTCPQIEAIWSLENYSGRPYTVSVECSVCEECPGPATMEPCGCYDFIPETIYATISPGTPEPDPPETPGQNASCVGANGTIVLRAQRAAGAVVGWFGCGYPFAGCPDLRMCLELRCVAPASDGSGLQLTIRYDNDAVHTIFADEASCDPYSGAWRGINKDQTCCQSVGIVENVFDIVITE